MKIKTKEISLKYNLKENDLIFNNDNRQYILRIKDIPFEGRPRERLLEHGPKILTAKELLAIVLNSGTKKEGVLEMTSRIINEYGEKNIINQIDPKVIKEEFDIPEVKACQIVACFELGRRFFGKRQGRKTVLRTAKQVFSYLKEMSDFPKEQLRGLYLNSRYQLIHDEVISIGSLTANIVHPREIFRPALEYSSAAIILAHNHPSGSLKPSQEDIFITEQLVQAGKMIGIDILDHIIIANNKFFSIPVDYGGKK